MSKHTIEFYECEHHGDLDYYIDDLLKSGATVVNSHVDHDAEIGHVVIEVDDKKKFMAAFKETISYEVSSLS